MVYGTRVCPGWYQGAPRPARGRRERDVVFGMLMVDTEHPTSNTQHPTPNIQHPTSNTQHPKPIIKNPTSNTQHPTPNIQHPTPNIQHPTSNTQHPTSNGRQQGEAGKSYLAHWLSGRILGGPGISGGVNRDRSGKAVRPQSFIYMCGFRPPPLALR